MLWYFLGDFFNHYPACSNCLCNQCISRLVWSWPAMFCYSILFFGHLPWRRSMLLSKWKIDPSILVIYSRIRDKVLLFNLRGSVSRHHLPHAIISVRIKGFKFIFKVLNGLILHVVHSHTRGYIGSEYYPLMCSLYITCASLDHNNSRITLHSSWMIQRNSLQCFAIFVQLQSVTFLD